MHEYPREELGPEAGRRWLALAPEDRADALILAPTHAIRRQVNETVREGLEGEGLLHGRVLVVDRLVNRRLTRAQASDLRSYEPGDTVVFHRSVFGCRAGDVCMVTGRDGGQVVLAGPDGGERRFRPSGNASAYLGLYDTERLELRAGDRIRWTRNRKAPPARFGHPRQPDLVNGGEAEILEIDRKRVRFRDEVGRTFSFLLSDSQLRHLDHAYCSTVHGAQGRTARGVIAVLDAYGAMDQAMFHVEVSRAAEAFLLLTDDREALVEMLEARPGREEGALEALGLDPAEPPVVEPELFEVLAADWRALRGQAGETDAQPFSLPGYEEVMVRAAAFSIIEDLPADMRGFVDGMLAEHERHVAHDRGVRGLAERIREHWRRWPELGWLAVDRGCAPEELPEYPAWREEGAALLEAARGLELVPGLAGGIEGEVAALERTRLRDDCGRFRRDWLALSVRAIRDGVPEVHVEGCPDVAEMGRRLSEVEGLDPAGRRMVEAWRAIHDRQSALADAVRSLPDRAAAWRERRAADLPLDEHGGADPVDPACRAWREEGEALRDEAAGMLEAESPHAPHLDAVPGAREAVDEALAEIDGAVQEDRYRRFAWLTRHVAGQSRETKTASFHLPRYPELIAHARTHAGDEALTEDRNRIVNNWLGYHERCTRLCAEIRDWPAQADAVLGEWTGPEKDLRPMRRWRERAEPLLAGARAMLADGSPHAPHLAAMPEERAALVETAGWLNSALIEIEAGEMERLAEIAEEWAAQTGGIAFDAREHGELMERVRSLDARPRLPELVREAVGGHLARHERLEKNRADVDAFLDLAGRLLFDRDRLARTAPEDRAQAALPLTWEEWKRDADALLADAEALRRRLPQWEFAAHLVAAGAGPDAIGEAARKIADRIAADEEARAAAERERKAEEQARIDAEQQRLEEERRQERNQGGGISMS